MMNVRAPLLALTVSAAALTACSQPSAGPTSQPTRSPASTTTTPTTPGSNAGRADLTVDGHTHTISGAVICTPQAGNPTGTPPLGDLAIRASDETASFAMSWLSNATSPVVALTLTYKVDNADYSMPYFPQPLNVQASVQGNRYTVTGAPPIRPPGDSTLKKVPIEIHAICPPR